ncbi:MAG TPA: hypothetical protein VKV19_16935 [Ktedonobacteraceae bacterium]|nr:hypothetical protein [Ktedonobacteraceae bacterium]
MRCMNCGLPLSPERALANCPRCGMPLNALQGARQQQFEQANWGNMGGAPQQNPWAQSSSSPLYNPFTQQNRPSQANLPPPGMSGFGSTMGSGLHQTPLAARRPSPPPKKRGANPRLLFIVAGLCIFLSALLLGLVAVLGLSGSSHSPQNTANSGANTSTTSNPPLAGASPTTASTGSLSTPTTSPSPSATATVYPGQQYIYDAQMATGADLQTAQTTTTFKVGTTMYVVFKLNPLSQGGAVCVYWYLNGTQVVPYAFAVKGTTRSSYADATYNQPGQAYVQLYWANDKSCSGQVLAQQVNFTVTS